VTHAVEALDERDSLGARSSASTLQSDEISAASAQRPRAPPRHHHASRAA